MLNQSKKLTDGLIIYSVLVSEYEKMDFKNDALAGVRANYFNSSCTEQKNKTEVVFEDKTYNLAYQMKEGDTISWKITRNNQPYQSVKKATGGVYSVIFYGDNGIVYKRQYFNNKHIWLRTEYFDKAQEDILIAVISPKNILGVIALHLEKYNENGDKEEMDLFPSSDIGKTNSSALVYSNSGMLWYDSSFMPEDMPELEIENDEMTGFVFNSELIEDENSINFNVVDSLNEDILSEMGNSEAEISFEDSVHDNEIQEDVKPVSAYEQIEKILTEAHKTNKDLFGEIISQTAGATDENDIRELFNETEQTQETVDEQKVDEVANESVLVEEISEDVISEENNTEEIVLEQPVEETVVDNISHIEETNSCEAQESLENELSVSEDDEILDDENNSESELSDEVEYEITESENVDEFKEDTEVIVDIEQVVEDSSLTEFIEETNAEDIESTDELTEIYTAEEHNVESVQNDETIVEENNTETLAEFEQSEKEDEFEIGESKPCDVVIVTKAGRYSYFGSLDENNCRTGRGRTVAPDGYTSYDGEYKNDKKDGFGVCYYKNGDINYVGNWSDNNRNGCGVGYRLSDGTMHIGKWEHNKPQNIGARFDNEGNFIDVSNYVNGVKNGKSISFDDNGNIIISMWENGEKTFETLIKSEDFYG